MGEIEHRKCRILDVSFQTKDGWKSQASVFIPGPTIVWQSLGPSTTTFSTQQEASDDAFEMGRWFIDNK